MRKPYLILSAAVLVVAGATAAGILAVAAISRAPYPVHISSGVNPRLPRERVAQIVISRIGPDAAIERMDVLADDTHVREVEPQAAKPVEAAPVGPVWVVRARGHFVGRHTPPGAAPVVAKTGYFVIDDNSGDILEMGMP